MTFLRPSITANGSAILVPALAFVVVVFTFNLVMAFVPLSAQRKNELTNLVRQDCGSCHGMTMQGGLGKPLLPENLIESTPEELAEIILAGVPGTPMPPWRGLLARGDALWIAAQLKTGRIKRGNTQ